MPKVGGKHFDYTAKGIAKAKNYAKSTGKALKMNKGGYIEDVIRAKKGKVVSPKGKKCVFGIAMVSGKNK
jgi:hypothetical protein